MTTAAPLRVEDLAAAADLSVDTVRYYQRLGLLHRPRRVGRRAEYDTGHLERLAEIRRLAAAGFTLRQIADLADGSGSLQRLADDARARRLSRHDVAEAAGVPESLVTLLCDNGLLQPHDIDGEPRFDESAVTMVRAGLAISAAGVPLDELVTLAADHAGHVTDTVDRAVALFADHVKGDADADEELAAIVRALLPAVTRLVAEHFHRTLVTRALDRATDEGRRPLASALESAHADRLVVDCSWR